MILICCFSWPVRWSLSIKLDEASAIIKQAEAIEPGSARVAMLAGLISRRQGKFEVAEQHLRAAIEAGLSEKEEIEAFNQLGLTLDAIGNAKEAFAAFEHSNHTHDPSSWRAKSERGDLSA